MCVISPIVPRRLSLYSICPVPVSYLGRYPITTRSQEVGRESLATDYCFFASKYFSQPSDSSLLSFSRTSSRIWVWYFFIASAYSG